MKIIKATSDTNDVAGDYGMFSDRAFYYNKVKRAACENNLLTDLETTQFIMEGKVTYSISKRGFYETSAYKYLGSYRINFDK